MHAIASDTPPPGHLARRESSHFEHLSAQLGMHYWQRTLLAVTMLQLKLPRRAFATPVVTLWNDLALEMALKTSLAPQAIARLLAVVQICGCDARSAYDEVPLGTQLGGSLCRPPTERTPENKAKAFSYGAYRALLDFFPGSEQQEKLRRIMTRLGYDPNDDSTDTTTAAGIGNVAAAAVLGSGFRRAPVRWVI